MLKKRFILILAVLIMICLLLPTAAFTEDGVDYTWEVLNPEDQDLTKPGDYSLLITGKDQSPTDRRDKVPDPVPGKG